MEIDCPLDCVYLTGEHAGAWDGRETERRRDMRRIAPCLEPLSEAQSRLFFLALVGVLGLKGRQRDLGDALLLEAVSALRRTVETRAKGVLYEHQAEDARAQGLVFELGQLFAAKDEDGRPVAPDDRDLLATLTALENGLAHAILEKAGPEAFLETAARLLGRMQGAPLTPPRKPLIVEP